MADSSRRKFLKTALKSGGLVVAGGFLPEIIHAQKAPAIFSSLNSRPLIQSGVSSGDVLADQAMIWSKADRPSRMHLKWATTSNMKNAFEIKGPSTIDIHDFTAKKLIQGLPPGQDIFYEVQFQSLSDLKAFSEPVRGHFRTAPLGRKNISFCWSGDTAGQGWGINPDWGGMRIYESMRKLNPDFFIHSGDTIYADGPIEAEVKLRDGSIWKNITTEAKSKVAETLEEFRGNYAYNLQDKNIKTFNAEVPIIYQWDDHETTNNWYPVEILNDDRYTEKNVALLSARSRQAFLEYNPIRSNGYDAERIYRHIPYGPLLDVFVLDMRSYRGDNSFNVQKTASSDTDLLGRPQLRWLKSALLNSDATWKVIASDMPIGLVVPDYDEKFENGANGDGPPLGRELEMMDLLRFIKHNNIQNVVWLTADVHYTAAHYYDPNQAQFSDFKPFYEFVSGPLNSGTFGPNALDNTFGPKVLYQKYAPAETPNLPPSAGMQFFGQVEIDGQTEGMRVNLRDLEGDVIYSVDLEPEGK